MEARSSIAIIAGTLLVCMALVAVMNTETNPASLSDTASTELSNDQGGTSTNGRVDLSIVGCAGFNCQRRYICIDKWKRCTDNWCTVNCNHGPSFCPKSYCLGQKSPPPPPPPSGCDGVANSGKVDDACGVCDGDGSSCDGCDGVANSGKVQDACGVCGGNGKSCAGCDGVLNSGKVYDACGVCGGDSSSCAGCDGVANSVKVQDVCGVCGGDGSSCDGCDGVANSGKVKDACGVCGGDGKSCAGCDGVANSGKVDDACGVCDGDGSSCANDTIKAKCTWSEVLVPNMKCAFTTGIRGVSQEECQAKAEAAGDAFYSWRHTDVQTLNNKDGKEFVTDQCFTTKTCDNVLSTTWNDWKVFYCTPADSPAAQPNMCQPSKRGLACCSATCDTCGGPDCASGDKGSECCPETIDKADKNCATNLPPCVFSPGGFPTKDVDYKDYAGQISPESNSEGQAASHEEPIGQSDTTFGKYGSPKEIQTKKWLQGKRCEVSANYKKNRLKKFGKDGCHIATNFGGK